MRTAYSGIDKMAKIQRSRRFSNGTCGRRLNGFVQNSQECRPPYWLNVRSSFLAGRRFFSHSLHAFILTRRLEFLDEALHASTRSRNPRLRCGKEMDVVRKSPGNPRCVQSPRSRTMLRENPSEPRQARGALQGRAAGTLIQERIHNDRVHMQCGESLYSGDNILFFSYSFFVCEFTTTFGRREFIL
jgi:hypothetical protein